MKKNEKNDNNSPLSSIKSVKRMKKSKQISKKGKYEILRANTRKREERERERVRRAVGGWEGGTENYYEGGWVENER
jgi:hypothetical protein